MLLLGGGRAAAEDGELIQRGQRADGRGSWHVVRPGETLHSIAELYLGSAAQWRELADLNGWLADPDRIEPGQRLRVLREPKVPPRTARLSRTARRVEGQLSPLPWGAAEESLLLKVDDGVQTREESSAELTFDDLTRLLLTENTLVYIGGSGRAERREVSRDRIEVVAGQADLESRKGSRVAEDIEIVVGASRARPRPGNDGLVQTRLRLPEDGRAAFMVYGGESEVEAGGRTVQVAEGMGTTVAEGEAPAPPEELLPAPIAVEPAIGSEWPRDETRFLWRPVEGAVSYTVEVCADPSCASLVARRTGIGEESLTLTDLPVAAHFWRVTATSPSGLDGYPSTAADFQTVEKAEDRVAPTVRVLFSGRQPELGEVRYVSSEVGIEIEVEDEASGVATWWPILDGERREPADLEGPWRDGTHTVAAWAEDHAGNSRRSETYRFTRDSRAPLLSWGLDEERLGSARGTGSRPRPADGGGSAASGLEWSVAGGAWRTLEASHEIPGSDGAIRLALRPVEGRARIDTGSGGLEPSRKRPLWLRVEDRESGIESLVLRFVPSGGAGTLVLEAEDRVGHRTRAEWSVR